jgi:HPt (histidine-containing phosphotransfer) domain-containing protein
MSGSQIGDKLIDFDDFKSRCGEDTELLNELLEMFENDAEEKMARIERAMASKDIVGLKAAAHGLKGSSANVSALAISKEAKRLEGLAATSDLKEAAKSSAALRVCVQATIEFIKKHLDNEGKVAK